MLQFFPIFPLYSLLASAGACYKTGAKQTHAEEMEVERVKVFFVVISQLVFIPNEGDYLEGQELVWQNFDKSN